MQQIWTYLGLLLLSFSVARGGVADLSDRAQNASETAFALQSAATQARTEVDGEAHFVAPHGPKLPAQTAELETTASEPESEDDDSADERVFVASAAELGEARDPRRVGDLHDDPSRMAGAPDGALPFARGPPASA